MSTRIKELHQEFFRTEPDFSGQWIYLARHLVVAAAYLFCYRNFILNYQDRTEGSKLKSVLTLVLIGFLFCRYFINRDYYQGSANLPLHTCNLSAIILVIHSIFPAQSFWRESIMVWGVLAGFYGGFLAIVFGAPGQFDFPHITRLDYYLGHFCISIFSTYYLLEGAVNLTRETLLSTSIITLVYLLIMSYLNPKLDSNFGFITHPPEQIEGFVSRYVSLSTYKVLCCLSYLFINANAWILARSVFAV